MLEGRSYVPLLHARLAEMRALKELPASTKNLVVPVIRIRPWLNAKHLDRVFEVIADALGERAFGLDLDPFKYNPASERDSYQEFARLFDPSNGYSAYYDCAEEELNRIPVLRRTDGETIHLEDQLDRVEEIDRGLMVRVLLRSPGDYLRVAQECLERELQNTVFVFDCGWRRDVLDQAAACTGIVERLLALSDDFEIVVAGSSFPDSFTGLGDRFQLPVAERLLFQEVRRNLNRGTLVYGDWGSTRPPTEPVPMMNIPRIDRAARLNWTCWRSDDGESYRDVAERVVDDDLWNEDSGLWGDYMIASTAEGLDPCIKSPAMAAAVRVNLHMHIQAHFEEQDSASIPDEPVGEDL